MSMAGGVTTPAKEEKMYINDPFDLAQPPVFEEEEIFEDEPRDYHDFFGDDIVLYPHKYAGYDYGVQTQTCKFDDEGKHYQMAENCPHYDAVDEEGPRIVPGWTVQSR
jgi:hypothetical protein